jgi:hypothetical protein
VFDTLFNNTTDIQPEIHSTNTHGASLWTWTKSFGNWLKSGSEPRPLWR